ncbi:glycosyltransferase family 4 protein [Candidatus Omnitrophota bacterium]
MDDRHIEKGIKKIVFITPKCGEKKYLDFRGIDVAEYDGSWVNIKGLPRLSKYIASISRKYSLDLLHCHAAIPDGVCCLAAKCMTGVPYMVTCHGSDLATDKRFGYGNRLKFTSDIATRLVLKGASGVTTLSTDMARFAQEAGVTPSKLRIIPEAIDTLVPVSCTKVEETEKVIREKYRIKDENTVYLTLSGMRKIKGHESLVRAFAKALEQTPDMILAIGAHGQETVNIKTLVKDLGIENKVRFIGFVDGSEKKAWFNIANVYCNTAFFEPFGIVYLESILHDTAVLGSMFGGAKDIFKHGENACIVDPANIEEIAQHIVSLRNKDQREHMVTKAREILPRYDIRKIADEYLDMYTLCLKK